MSDLKPCPLCYTSACVGLYEGGDEDHDLYTAKCRNDACLIEVTGEDRGLVVAHWNSIPRTGEGFPPILGGVSLWVGQLAFGRWFAGYPTICEGYGSTREEAVENLRAVMGKRSDGAETA